MMSSVDGRTLTKQWGDVKGMEAYEKTGSKHKADAWMCGRITMERDFASDKPLKLNATHSAVDKKDFIADHQAKSFAIAVDAGGKLHWDKAYIDSDHIISVLTEKAPEAYLAYLQQTGISYLICGKTVLDFEQALEKLGTLFPIKTLLLEGGGHLNGSLLNAGLIDELSFLHMPLADGLPDTPTIFEVDKSLKKAPATHLKLMDVEKLPHDVLWLRYKVLRHK
jgi:riboflavin biosynthesis pyrimidine reductase